MVSSTVGTTKWKIWLIIGIVSITGKEHTSFYSTVCVTVRFSATVKVPANIHSVVSIAGATSFVPNLTEGKE
jgi:hypothetical protein